MRERKKPRKLISLEDIEIQPFHERAVLNRFNCGRAAIDRFLKNKAKRSISRREFRVFCAFIQGSENVIGYYALQIGSDNVLDLPTGHNTYLKNYTAFPAVHVGFLGVHEDYQGNGIGKYLLMDAFDKVCAISDCAGFYALTLQSLDADSTAFYEEIGFRAYSEGDGNPKMLYPINNLIKLVRDE